MSPPVAPEKDSKQPEWEMICVTYPLDGNICNQLDNKDLWKMTIEKEACFVSFCVRALDLRNGKLAAHLAVRGQLIRLELAPRLARSSQ